MGTTQILFWFLSILAIFSAIMVVAAAEVSVGLAIIAMLYRNTHSVDVNFLNRLKH